MNAGIVITGEALTEAQKKRVTRMYRQMQYADAMLDEAVKEMIALEDESGVPALNGAVVQEFAKTVNNIDFNLRGFKTFLSLSVLGQVVKEKKNDYEEAK